MYSIEQVREYIEKSINELEFNEEPKELYEPIRYVFETGGKRLRPLLTLMACNLYDENLEGALTPALGLEIFHNFTLLHDDIMDEADLRRNRPTVHKRWDQNVAILSGDVMAILAYEYITTCKVNVLPDVIKVFNTTARQVCEGQQFDMNFETLNQVSVEAYLKMIEMKTSVLLAGCMQIGALIGGAGKKDAELLFNFGRDIGMAFQIQDDLLDTYGDTEVFGKRIGGDILANKKTYLLIKALEKADKNQNEILNNLINGSVNNPQDKIDAVKNIYNELEIKELTNNLAGDYFKNALLSLDKVQVSEERKIHLKQLADLLLNRDK
ncbi:MAG: polyprenyl synthetase family protein [Bacteroidales bacterium]|nr:polyprenyl synthetase family protein [Bacteroidales bacterium]